MPIRPTGGLLFRSAGGISAGASAGPALRGGPGAGSRYHCAVAGATAVRRSPVPPGGGLRAASGRAGRSGIGRSRPARGSATAGVSSLLGGPFLPALFWPHRFGADPGRIALPLRRRRRDGGPAPLVPPGGGLGAASGRAGANRRGNSPYPLATGRWAAFPFFDGRDSGPRFFCSVGFERKRQRTAALQNRRRRGGAPVPPGGGLGSGRATTAPSPARRRSDAPLPPGGGLSGWLRDRRSERRPRSCSSAVCRCRPNGVGNPAARGTQQRWSQRGPGGHSAFRCPSGWTQIVHPSLEDPASSR